MNEKSAEAIEELSYKEREMRAEARGYEYWRVRAFVSELRRNPQHLLDFFYLQHRSLCSQASEPVAKLIDAFVHDLNHWERTNIMYQIADDVQGAVLKHAKYLSGIARKLDEVVQEEAKKPERRVHHDLVTGERVFSVTAPTKEEIERMIRAEFARTGMMEYRCSVCGENPVDPESGYNTCCDCLKKQ